MSLRLIIDEALKALARNRVRSLLTMLGIIMGVGSFICVVAVGNAGSSRVEDQLSKVGDNQAVMEQVPGMKAASPNVDGHVQAVYGNLNWGTQYRGVSPEYFDIRK